MTDPYAGEKLDCDIVMKGGITSGVVYPGAVMKLSQRYRFRSIGGTSAGAIAAAIVAAAEHARQHKTSTGGFATVAKLPQELSKVVDGRPFMLQLFQPDEATRPLFEAALGFLDGGPRHGLKTTAKAFWHAPAATAAVGAASLGLAITKRIRPSTAAAAAGAALPLLAGGMMRDVLKASKTLPANDFGLCRLGPTAGSADAPALTPWLHAKIQEAAGLAPTVGDGSVLSFADLWGAPPLPANPLGEPEAVAKRRLALRQLSAHPESRTVDLQMMSTDLTHGRPWRLPVPFQPYADRLEDGGRLLFDPAELAEFFPAAVIAHMQRAAQADPFTAKTLTRLAKLGGTHLRRFPIGPDLPVIVATRMSLSFPVLISAIPLWELDYSQGTDNAKLRRVIFSDGGISSNFPVHFFDGPLPRRPTFGLHLTGFPPGKQPTADSAVIPPPNVNAQTPDDWREVISMGGFFVAIKDAMQNWRDNAQARLPGFRDRIAHICLGEGEGGLNLTMSSDKIIALNARGERAGEALVDRFAERSPGKAYAEHWDDHRFARFRITMSLIERLLKGFESSYVAPAPMARDYASRISAGNVAPYKYDTQGRLKSAQTTTANLCAYATAVTPASALDDAGVPRPPSTLRTVPPV